MSSPQIITYSFALFPAQRGRYPKKIQPQFIGLRSLPAPETWCDLKRQLSEMGSLASVQLMARIEVLPERLKLFGRIRRRTVARFDIPSGHSLFVDDDIRWRLDLRGGESVEDNPLHNCWMEYALGRGMTVASERYPLRTYPPNVDAILFSRAEIRPVPKAVLPLRPDPLRQIATDFWAGFQERAKLSALKP
jgi:hypothetical protein